MSERAREVFSLAHFPTELLEPITRFILGADVTQLYLCGSVALNRKLRNGGVVELTIHLTKETPRWSFRLLKLFKKLRFLRVWSPSRAILGFDRHIVDMLPRELEVLEVVSPQSTTMWSVLVSPREGFEAWTTYPLGSKFPFLRRLKLTDYVDLPDITTAAGWTSGGTTNCLPDEVLVSLPGSLRDFETCGTTLGSTNRAEKLPRRLTSLVLHKELSDALYLPKSLTKLYINDIVPGCDWLPPKLKYVMIGNSTLRVETFAAFPRSLTEIHLPNVIERPDERLDFSIFPLLTTLDLGTLSQCNEVFALPPKLTALRLGNWNLSDAFFRWIPQSITRLDIKSDNIESNQSALKFPKALRQLYMPFCIYIETEFLDLLPKTVQILRSPLVSRYYGVILQTDQVSYVDNTPWCKP